MKMAATLSPGYIPEGNSKPPTQVILLTTAVNPTGAVKPATSVSLLPLISLSTTASTNTPKITSVSSSKNELKTVAVLKPAMASVSDFVQTQNNLSKSTNGPKQKTSTNCPIAPKPVNAPANLLVQKISKTTNAVSSLLPLTSATEKEITELKAEAPVCVAKEKSETWSHLATEKLIAMFRERPYLYDRCDPFFGFAHKRTEALEDIATELMPVRPNTTAQDVRKKLKSLRQQFVNTFLLRKKRGDPCSEVSRENWLYNRMKFLIPFVKSDGFNEDSEKMVPDTCGETERAVKSVQFMDLEPETVSSNADRTFSISDYKEPPPNCTQENGDEPAEQPVEAEPACIVEVQSLSPARKRKRKDVIAEERKSKERRECLNLAVRENGSVMSSFFDYLQAECSQIQDSNILVNLKTKLFNLVMESVKLDLSKRTDSTPSFNSLVE